MKHGMRYSFELFLVATIFLATIVLLEIFKTTPVRLLIITFLTLFYIVFGIYHHFEERNLKVYQVLEYAAIGILIFVVLTSLYG